uniref:3'-phosphate/5'-hydroxy nucleic acid ligase n=1 Tax=viral metagenome TaxID=1070528 RepID=A0A6M3J6J9_9ZZZZ
MEKISKKLVNFASILEENTRAQAVMTSEMPFVYPHLALMPDAHLGKGATVGSVIPTKGAIMPAAVGVDIGCGMIAVKTQFNKTDLEGKDLKALHHSITRSIPLSAGRYNSELTDTAKERTDYLEKKAEKDYAQFVGNWKLHLGTLGSGNHFIEISLDEDDGVWLFLHSGSRGIGNKIAMHHIKVAQKLMERYFIKLPDEDLAYLVEGTEEFSDYIKDLRWAQEFALLNREEMMDRVIKDFQHWMGESIIEKERVNCHHNFTQQENHMGQNLWVSRKGAISAGVGMLGLIPGSMGTASYVVEGKGFVPAFGSAPHGAGRNYSRSAARKEFSRKDLDETMKGIVWGESDAFVDEIPQAYKPIDTVIKDADELIVVRHTLRQIINVKGD